MKKIQILLLLILSGPILKSQDSISTYKNSAGMSLSEIAFVDFRLAYERRFAPIHALRIELGYKPAYQVITDATIIDLGQDVTAWCYRNTAMWKYVSLAYKYFYGKTLSLYVSPEVFYKSLHAEPITYTYGISNSDPIEKAYELRSMDSRMYGLNIIAGKQSYRPFFGNTKLGLDIFLGISMRLKHIDESIYGHTTAMYGHDSSPPAVTIPLTDTPETDNRTMFQFGPQIGIRIFVCWN